MFLPLLLSVLLFGLPHGALDHQVPGLLGWRWARHPAAVAGYLLLYAGLAGALLLGWLWAPLLAFWGFLVASLLHWGQGDLHTLEAVLGRRRPHRWSAAVAILARGSLPILLPLLAFPGWFLRLAQGAARAFGVAAWSGPLLGPALTLGLTLGLVAVLLLYTHDTLRASPHSLRELGEATLLLVVFLQVPPPLAIGLYFSLWHAWRHLGRLLALRQVQQELRQHQQVLGQDGQAPAALGRPALQGLALQLLPITLLAFTLLGGIYLWAAPRVHDTETLVALYLAVIAALTGPHALLVALMDRPAATAASVPAARLGRPGSGT
jgi:beta-carotene 15,15'-dioxygenase